MSAIPIRQTQPVPKRPVILEIANTGNTLDVYGDRLASQGYEIVSAANYDDALKSAHQVEPVLILVYDDPTNNIDALRWLEIQHMDRKPRLAMVPLLILADSARVPYLHFEELPDRVVVLQRRSDTLNQLTRAVKRLLRIWELD